MSAELKIKLEPGDVVMHPIQFNRYVHLMRTQRGGEHDGLITWNGVPVKLDSNMPTTGWWIVPG